MGLFMNLNMEYIESLTAEEILNEAYLLDWDILDVLNYLRWPETNGTPVRPEGCNRKKFNYKTMQVFAWSKLSDRQILALIFCARDEYPLPKVFKLVRIKHRNVKKWIDSINEEFCGEIVFPEPDERFLSRRSDKEVDNTPPPKVATKSEVAFFIMANKDAKENVFQARFRECDLGQVRGIHNSLIGKKRSHLELVSQGIDPYEKHTVERSRIEGEIADQEKIEFDSLPARDGDEPPYGKKHEKDYVETESNFISLDDLDNLVGELRIPSRSEY